MNLPNYYENDYPAFTTQVKRLFPHDAIPVNLLEYMFVMYVVGRYGDVQQPVALLQPRKENVVVPAGYTDEELERDNPYNAWMYEQ